MNAASRVSQQEQVDRLIAFLLRQFLCNPLDDQLDILAARRVLSAVGDETIVRDDDGKPEARGEEVADVPEYQAMRILFVDLVAADEATAVEEDEHGLGAERSGRRLILVGVVDIQLVPGSEAVLVRFTPRRPDLAFLRDKGLRVSGERGEQHVVDTASEGSQLVHCVDKRIILRPDISDS